MRVAGSARDHSSASVARLDRVVTVRRSVQPRPTNPLAQVGGLATGRVLRPTAGHSKRRSRITRSTASVAATMSARLPVSAAVNSSRIA